MACSSLTKRFRGGQVAVDHVGLDVPRGSVYGFLGPNGSGKTTTIRMLLGLTFPTSGSAELLGVPMPAGASAALPRVGSLIEEPAFYPFLTGHDNLARYDAAARTADPRTARARIAEALDRVGLLGAARKRYRHYSLGMKQRLAIAACLLRPRDLLPDFTVAQVAMTEPAASADRADAAAMARRGERYPGRAWLRFLRSELRVIFGRRRNQALLAVVALFPVLIGVALRAASRPGSTGGPSVAFINQLAGNGIFLTFIALTLLLTLVMPVVMAVISGDSMAGEAGYGTLRYLLTAPAGRARILTVKYAAIVVFAVTATALVTGVALAAGAALFPLGPVTLLSGTTVPLADGIIRLLLVTLYVAAALASLGAIGLAISTCTGHPISAIAAVTILVVASEVTDNVPQFGVIHPYLPTHWWSSFDALLRVPVGTGTLLHGLLSFGMYVLLSGSIAWARFTTASITC